MLASKQNSPRSYRIVGPQRQLDERETPHPRVDRGEFGARLRDWRKNRVGSDPFRRLFGGGGEGAGLLVPHMNPIDRTMMDRLSNSIHGVADDSVACSDPCSF